MLLVVAVGRALTLEVVTSHGPGEALALAHRRHVDLLAGGEDAGVDLLTDRVRVRVVHPQLDQAAAGLDARAGEMASLGLVEGLRPAQSVGDLDGRVAVTLGRLDLHDPHGGDLDQGHGNGAVALVPDLGHADLLADDRLGCHLWACCLSVP